MKALVTGGAGFIGSHIADALLQRGYQVRVLDNLQPRVHPRGKPDYVSPEIEFIHGDVRDKRAMERALAGVAVVFHAAAYQDYMCDYSTFFDCNVTGTALIFELVREKHLPLQKVIISSSQAVYGEGQYRCSEHGFQMPLSRSLEQLSRGEWNLGCATCHRELEPLLLEEEHTNPATSYGLTKLFQEMVAYKLGRIVGVPAVGLRYSITQGTRQSFYNAYSGICRIFTRALRDGKPVVVYEDGLQQRDYIHVTDVVRANLMALDTPQMDFESYNVGTGQTTTVVEYAQLLAEVIGTDMQPVVPGEYRVGDVRHTVSGNSKLGRLGWKPTKGLREIFCDYLAWLDTLHDGRDYFTPAYTAMKESGVVRSIHNTEGAEAAVAGAQAWSHQKRS
jgi:dTDP-L-rhamnose 4-epimerase